MSADIYVEATDCCWSHNHNITHNLAGMFRAVGLDWHDFYERDGNGGKTAAEMLPLAVLARHRLERGPEDFAHLAAPNGWGTLPQAVSFLDELVVTLATHPDGIVRVSL
jgi:hypothetical protein